MNLSWLTSEGYANIYYAATVKNMLTSWHNFFFASYDAGFVSVDKPPLGFWIQATNAYLFGFHGWSLLLPQALAGVLCVALLYHLAQRILAAHGGIATTSEPWILLPYLYANVLPAGRFRCGAWLLGPCPRPLGTQDPQAEAPKAPGVEAHPRTQVAGWRS